MRWQSEPCGARKEKKKTNVSKYAAEIAQLHSWASQARPRRQPLRGRARWRRAVSGGVEQKRRSAGRGNTISASLNLEEARGLRPHPRHPRRPPSAGAGGGGAASSAAPPRQPAGAAAAAAAAAAATGGAAGGGGGGGGLGRAAAQQQALQAQQQQQQQQQQRPRAQQAARRRGNNGPVRASVSSSRRLKPERARVDQDLPWPPPRPSRRPLAHHEADAPLSSKGGCVTTPREEKRASGGRRGRARAGGRGTAGLFGFWVVLSVGRVPR